MTRAPQRLPGIGGTLLPSRFLLEARQLGEGASQAAPAARRGQLHAWWRSVEATCGPATGMRTLLDRVALPLFHMLGFRVRDAHLRDADASAILCGPDDVTVAAIVRPWASQPPLAWRDVVEAATAARAEWCFLLAPPHLSLIDARGHVVRRSVDFTFPAVLDPASLMRFWRLASSAAFGRGASGAPSASLVAEIVAASQGFQARVTQDLQHGVVEALHALAHVVGRGGRHRGSGHGASALDEALTVIYRVLFLLYAESRDLFLRDHPVYGSSYSVAALCREAIAAPHDAVGLWDGLAAVTRLSRAGCEAADLIVRPFNGRLFARAAAPSLEARHRARGGQASDARDAALRTALVALGSRPGPTGREAIAYADLGVEQLGAVYERVLDLDPASLQPPRPAQRTAHSLRRKQTGTFYTPQPLADFVVRRTLAPLVKQTSADRILALRVVDPAMGSGAFLVAACRYLAHAYAHALIEEGRATAADLDQRERAGLRRLVAERCLAGVDVNPVAVQLARLSLWLTTLSAGKPLGFLDHRLRTGNSLVGAGPADLHRVPNRRHQTRAALPLFDDEGWHGALHRSAGALIELALRRDDDVRDVHVKEAAWRRLSGRASPLAPWRTAASLWCAPWFDDPDTAMSPSELRAMLDSVLRGDRTIGEAQRRRRVEQAEALADRYHFFHWPLEFADVFFGIDGLPRSAAGFDAVIGNPPWEMLRGDSASNARSLLRFVRESGLYPSCDRGHLNLYQPFIDRSLDLLRPGGRLGLVLPWGLASDDGAAHLRERLLERVGLDTVVGFDNAEGLFPIHRGVRFMALVAGGDQRRPDIAARFGVRAEAELDQLPELEPASGAPAYPVRLTPHLVRAIGGSTRRIPDVRSATHLDLLRRLVESCPRLGDSDGWSARFGRELNATEDRDHFGEVGLPVIEGKHLGPFVADVESPTARISAAAAARLLPDQRFAHARVGYRDVSAVGNKLTLIAALVPAGVVTTHTIFCLRTALAAERQHFLIGLLNSFVLNLLARMLMGGHLTTSLVEGLPVPRWSGSLEQRRIARLARRLSRAPRERGTRAYARLQAAVALLYDLDGPSLEQVLASFRLVGRETHASVLAEWRILAPTTKRARARA